MASTSSSPNLNKIRRRRRSLQRVEARPSLSLWTVLIFGALLALAATLFCWEHSIYQRWLASDRNPTEGVILRIAQSTSWNMSSSFEVKNPTLIREELAGSPKVGTTTIHFLCPISREGNFLMISLFQRSKDWWLLALPVP